MIHKLEYVDDAIKALEGKKLSADIIKSLKLATLISDVRNKCASNNGAVAQAVVARTKSVLKVFKRIVEKVDSKPEAQEPSAAKVTVEQTSSKEISVIDKTLVEDAPLMPNVRQVSQSSKSLKLKIERDTTKTSSGVSISSSSSSSSSFNSLNESRKKVTT